MNMLLEEPETRAVTQDKPYAGNTQNSSVLNALTSDPLLGFVHKKKQCLGSDAVGSLIYM